MRVFIFYFFELLYDIHFHNNNYVFSTIYGG